MLRNLGGRIASGEPGSPLLLCPCRRGAEVLVQGQDAPIIEFCRVLKRIVLRVRRAGGGDPGIWVVQTMWGV